MLNSPITDERSTTFPTKGVAEDKAERPLKRRRETDEDVAVLLRWRTKRLKAELPLLDQLREFVDSPLSEDEKIPIPTRDMQALVSSRSELLDLCTIDDVKLLFRADDDFEPSALDLLNPLVHAVQKRPPEKGTEDAFHSFWDQNIRQVLELLVPLGTSIRNSSKHTITRALRPDYAFLLNNMCPFRGEEKPPGSTDDPKAELADKLVWSYAPAPYVLAYYATGPDLTLAAITPPSTPGGRPVVHNVAPANLSLRKDRIKNICRLINVARLLQTLADLDQTPDAEFRVFERDDCTVEITGRNIVKSYTSVDRFQRVENLQNVYHLLRIKKVPRTDKLVYFSNTTVILSPRGTANMPKTEEELLEALICVLEALKSLHQAPALFHRDIRWPNVIRCLDDPHSWFLIDWEDAAAPPTKAQPHFDKLSHSPKIFTDGHGPEVDLWGVGELISRSTAMGVSFELQELGKWMQTSSAPSAEEALARIVAYHQSLHQV